MDSNQVTLANSLTLKDFQYDLPEELIAQAPLPQRHNSRLMVVERQGQSIFHHSFLNIATLLKPRDLLIVNDTRVIPARLLARKQSGRLVQILLLHQESSKDCTWHALASPLKKLRAGDTLTIEPSNLAAPSITVKDIVKGPDGYKRLILDLGSPDKVYSLLSQSGYAPLPPYIKRPASLNKRLEDLERYQTIYATTRGAVAAPTAGLHFSQLTIQQLRERGVEIKTVTLHVGPGTFKPITTSLAEHSIESETYSVPETTAAAVNLALASGRRIIAVGTTSLRALETAGSSGQLIPTSQAQTSLYVKPGFQFKIVSGLITNFHLSGSSLLVLVSTFAGHELIMKAYKQAIEERYRFFSYGDAMLIL